MKENGMIKKFLQNIEPGQLEAAARIEFKDAFDSLENRFNAQWEPVAAGELGRYLNSKMTLLNPETYSIKIKHLNKRHI